MKTLLSLIASIGLVGGLVGCVGGIEEPIDPLTTPDGDGNENGDNPAGSDLSEAKALFDTTVYSPLKTKCGQAACHGEGGVGGSITKFVATDAARGWQVATNYSALRGLYDATTAPILTKIAAGHEATTYESTEIAAITAWLNKEIELRNGQPGGTDPTQGETLGAAAERVMQQFAGCLNVDDMQATNFAPAWGNKGSNEGQCEQCHGNGDYEFLANDDPAKMLRRLTMNKMEYLMYFTPSLVDGAAAAKMSVNRASFNGVCNGLDPHREHPRFNCEDDDQAILALQELYNLTSARVLSGNGCVPGTLTN